MHINFIIVFIINAHFLSSPSYCHESAFKTAEEIDQELHSHQIPPPLRQPDREDITKVLLELFDSDFDKNKDGFIDGDELKDWIETVHNKLIKDSVDQQWSYYTPDIQEVHTWEGYQPERKEVLHWERYINMTYPDNILEGDSNDPQTKSLKLMYTRAQRRWKMADGNDDSVLVKEEFKDFIHPEESQRARDVLVLEAIEDMDKDSNEEVSLEEYMNHLTVMTSEEEREDANWAKVQQDHFTNHLDKNKDGTLNNEELKEWIVPSYDRHDAESWRLISLGDENSDEKLSKDELTKHQDSYLTLIPPEFWNKYNIDDDLEPTEPTTYHDEF